MNEEDKNYLADLIRMPGWKLFEKWNVEAIVNYRILATQPPGAVPEELRTWYSALAAGREEAINELKQKLQTDEIRNERSTVET